MIQTINDQSCEIKFAIEGLRFEKNLIREMDGPIGWFTRKLLSSDGPLVSDFVTHEASFSYSTYGIHVGQDDRLTFMGQNGKCIVGRFVDCRAGSPTLYTEVDIEFAPSLARRLVVPRGVAHTFDNIEHIVTRDEPVWYSSEDNKDWNIDNDLISVARETATTCFPIVRANEHRLPDEVHQFQSKLSQSLLQNPKSYLARFSLIIGSKEQYVMFEPKSWSDDEQELHALLDVPAIPGVEVRRARYALTGPKSWTLVPNTGACVADVLLLPADSERGKSKFLHARTRKWYSFLTNQGHELQLDFVDCRRDVATFGISKRLHTKCDPRISIVIDPGIAYSINCSQDVLVRCEHEIFVDENEPRDDLPAFGQDLLVLSDEPLEIGLVLPNLRCPDELVRLMAKHEVSTFSEDLLE